MKQGGHREGSMCFPQDVGSVMEDVAVECKLLRDSQVPLVKMRRKNS